MRYILQVRKQYWLHLTILAASACRPVIIHRLLVQGSIEEQVIRIQESKHALLEGESCDNVATVSELVKNEAVIWGEMQNLIDALL